MWCHPRPLIGMNSTGCPVSAKESPAASSVGGDRLNADVKPPGRIALASSPHDFPPPPTERPHLTTLPPWQPELSQHEAIGIWSTWRRRVHAKDTRSQRSAHIAAVCGVAYVHSEMNRAPGRFRPCH